jgi:ketosteroid isomerase-like protein
VKQYVNQKGMMIDTPVPDADPSSLVAAYVSAFNSGSGEAVDELYEGPALVVPQAGSPFGGANRLTAHRRLIGFGLPITASVRQHYVVDNLALIIVDWAIRGTSAEGYVLDLAGSAADVARRGEDGRWRYVIDNPWGTAT